MNINRAYYNLIPFLATHRYIVVYGGRRSGKSFGVCDILKVRGLKSKRTILVLRKVGRTLKHSVYERISSSLNLDNVPYTLNKSDKEFTVPNGTRFICMGLDDPEKLKSIEGVTDIWLEEATEFTEKDFDTLDAGLSANSTPPPCIFLTFNPIPVIPGFEMWIQKTLSSRRVSNRQSRGAIGERCRFAHLLPTE